MTFAFWFAVALTVATCAPYGAGRVGIWLLHDVYEPGDYVATWGLGVMVLCTALLIIMLCSLFAAGISGL